jgi:hypothetical protein
MQRRLMNELKPRVTLEMFVTLNTLVDHGDDIKHIKHNLRSIVHQILSGSFIPTIPFDGTYCGGWRMQLWRG